LSTFPGKDNLISQVDELKSKLESKEKEYATMRHSLKILEEERIVLKMKSVTDANRKNISAFIGKTSIPSTLDYHADSLNPMIMEDSLTGNMKFADLL
jgi:sugar-specific transcriptional regulator TrmB